MIKFVNDKTGETVITESDNGDVKFHLQEDKKKEVKEDKEKDKEEE